jgi:electron transfer flavoprotein beta subunit
MNIVVPIKMVPDLVEALTIDAGGAALDADWLSLILNEFDNHAIEQAILLKEQGGGQVLVIAPDVENADDALFTAAAKGADRLLKLTGAVSLDLSNHTLAQMLAAVIAELHPDLVLTGVQTHNDIDGPLGALLAGNLQLPYVGYVAGVTVGGGKAIALKEFPGGLLAEMEVVLPAVLGIQAAQVPPRYVAFSRVRQAMTSATIEEVTAPEVFPDSGSVIEHLSQPESAEYATMLEGSAEQTAARLVEILQQKGML